MRGLICYYSATGNTRLACESLVRRLSVPFDLVDVIEHPDVDLAAHAVIGLASPTDFWSAPKLFFDFIGALPEQGGKPAFLLNTFGGFSGRTLLVLRDAAAARGLDVLAGHALHMPESYPPMIAAGLSFSGAPEPACMRRFDAFARSLDDRLHDVRSGRTPAREEIRVGPVDRMLPALRRTKARDDMGDKRVDAASCTECGRCARGCPYGAISLEPKPVFDETRCFGCWRCYNRCPRNAIRTRRALKAHARYPRPNEAVRRKLEETA